MVKSNSGRVPSSHARLWSIVSVVLSCNVQGSVVLVLAPQARDPSLKIGGILERRSLRTTAAAREQELPLFVSPSENLVSQNASSSSSR